MELQVPPRWTRRDKALVEWQGWPRPTICNSQTGGATLTTPHWSTKMADHYFVCGGGGQDSSRSAAGL
eukprot:scaffold382385_cov32-Prasinocladus_malaysianus.AAC.1